jgi:hypothetical protein
MSNGALIPLPDFWARKIRPEALFENRQCAPNQRLRVAGTIRASEQVREIVEADRHIRMVGAVAPLDNGELAAHHRHSLGEAVGVMKQLREIVPADRHVRMLDYRARSDRPAIQLQGMLCKGSRSSCILAALAAFWRSPKAQSNNSPSRKSPSVRGFSTSAKRESTLESSPTNFCTSQ